MCKRGTTVAAATGTRASDALAHMLRARVACHMLTDARSERGMSACLFFDANKLYAT